MKNVFKFNFLAVLLLSVPVFAVDGMAVIDMRTAVLSTQVAADAFKACLLYTSPSPRDED